MADETSSSNSRQPLSQTFWLAVAGMACLLLLALAALGMAFLLGRQQPSINVAPVTTLALPSPAGAPPQAPAPLNRPDKPGASRSSEAVSGAPQHLPGFKPDAKDPQRGGAALSVRADTQSPPYYTTLTPVSRVHLRLAPKGPEGLRGAVPFRVRQFQPGPDGRVPGVLAGVPAPGQEELYSWLPDAGYQAAPAKGALIGLELLNPRKSSTVNGLRAPKGFQFFVAELRASNLGSQPLAFEPDMFEIRDSDQVVYLPNPELMGQGFPAQPLAPGASAAFMTATLVPSDASLVSLAAVEPGGGVVSASLSPR